MDCSKSNADAFPWESDEEAVQVLDAAGFPPGHPAESELFVRQRGVPGHDQQVVERARVVMVGAGGLGSWAGLALVRSGVRSLTIVDPDRFDRTNAHRQLMYPEDLGKPKASALARNLVPHMIGGGTITAINLTFEEAIETHDPAAEVLLVLVDNNRCRWKASKWARRRRVPAVFTMLSLDGLRMHAFLQGGHPDDACLWCALPNLDPEGSAPCASGVMAACQLAAAHAAALAYSALAGEMKGVPNWRSGSLADGASETGVVLQRSKCTVCSS